MPGTTTTSGGAGKIIGGGRGIGGDAGIGGMGIAGGPGGQAIAETGMKATNTKSNTLKINFLIGFPPLFIIYSTT
jgi:hypothetical protein